MTTFIMMYVYILANQKKGVLYIGVTNNLIRRMNEHRERTADSFTKDHGITKLVYFESTEFPYDAISREKQLKAWHRPWKISLIERENPNWDDLYPNILG